METTRGDGQYLPVALSEDESSIASSVATIEQIYAHDKRRRRKRTIVNIAVIVIVSGAATTGFLQRKSNLLPASLRGGSLSSSFLSSSLWGETSAPQTPQEEDEQSISKHPSHPNTPLSDNSIDDNNANSNSHDKNENDEKYPAVAWLMSFPNSGTSFTLRLVHTVSNASIASNYNELNGHNFDELGRNIPVNPHHPDGPYLHKINYNLPHNGYILTKTHCDGKCTGCAPKGYIMTVSQFLEGCFTAKSVVPASVVNGTATRATLRFSRYENDVVKRAVHLIRYPFDNIVSRFHLKCNDADHRNDTEWMRRYPRNRNGFRAWCENMDKDYHGRERIAYREIFANETDPTAAAQSLSRDARRVPCHSEFHRFIQWHNHAFSVVRDLDIPSIVIHYEDYENDLEGTMMTLLNFLELRKVVEPCEYHRSDYGDYYLQEQKDMAVGWMKRLASKRTWEVLEKRYFS